MSFISPYRGTTQPTKKKNPKPTYRSMNQNSIQLQPDLDLMKAKAEKHYTKFLKALGFDLNDPNMQGTAERVSRMYVDELFSGVYNPPPKVTMFDLSKGSVGITSEMIVVGPLKVKSMCGHHMLPIVGEAHIGILLGGAGTKHLPGLSKYARIVNHYARRPQIQEQLTQQIMDDLYSRLNFDGRTASVIVVIKAKHFCMSHRGVEDSDSVMTTSSLSGSFKNQTLRSEFFSLANIG